LIQLAAFDLDGTLVDSKLQVRPRVRAAIARALEYGVTITLATGRMFSATRPFAEALGIRAPLICYQGGWIQGLETPVLHRDALPTSLARASIAMGKAQGWHTILYADGELYIDAMRHPQRFYEQLLGPAPSVEPELVSVLENHTPDKVLFVADPDEIPGMERLLTSAFGSEAEVVQSHARFIEIVPQHVTKGRALAWLADYYGLPRHAVLAAGDQQNDISMVLWAGVGIAMGNGVPALKAVADWIAPSLEEDGAAEIFARYILPEPGLAEVPAN